MTNKIYFLEQKWFWPVLVVAFLIWILFIWKEKKASPSAFPLWNTLIAFTAIGALALLVLQPVLRKSSDQGTAVLLTEAYSKNQLDSLVKKQKGIKRIRYARNMMADQLKGFENVFVVGNGIPAFDIPRFETINMQYLKNEAPPGIAALNYAPRITSGSKLNIKGYYQKPKPGHWLILEEPTGSAIDSVRFDSDLNSGFSLKTILKTEGKYRYAIVEKDSLGKRINTNSLPVIATNKTAPKILFINSSPSFETKYLKNFLADRSYEVLVKTKVSKDRYKTETFNTNSRLSGKNISELIRESDLLIVDINSLKNWSSSMLTSLKNEVTNRGLGLLIQTEEDLCELKDNWFCFAKIKDGIEEVTLKEFPKESFLKHPLSIKNEPHLFPLLTSGNTILAAYKKQGLGRIGVTVLRDTYEMILKGNPEIYNAVWSDILEQIARRKETSSRWIAENIPYTDEPFRFTLNTVIKNPIVQKNDSERLPVLSNMYIENSYSGVTYPKNPGWHTLVVKQDTISEFSFYSFETDDWKTIKTTDQIEENLRAFNSTVTNKKSVMYTEPVNSLWFFIIFLMALGYLWLYPKLKN